MPFDEIVTSLIRMAEDSVVSRHLTFEVTGGLGEVPADVATPLAVVLAELVQNAIEHAFVDFEAEEDGEHDGDASDGDRARSTGTHPGGPVVTTAACSGSRSSTTAPGLPDGFDIDETQSLGLSIVRDLVRSQLDGTIAMRNRPGRGPARTAPSWSSSCRSRDPQPIGQ